MEHALGLRGVRIISGEHGALLGRLCMVYVDPSERRIAAFSYRTGRVGGRELCIATGKILTATDDVIVVTSASDAHPISHDTLPGPSLTQLIGCRVTTLGGQHLGRLSDLLFGPDFTINGLQLDGRSRIVMQPSELTIGEELVVPDHCADNVALCPELVPSLMRALIFGSHTHSSGTITIPSQEGDRKVMRSPEDRAKDGWAGPR